ncbi:ankyrin repeat-containing domain protein [Apiospora marii]|uniref:Ankyrin repeat-containing domain protein n=1 Tax=Apiospora marii TaxID=335849 RepID=A0ABR1RGZ6_9PEZI
MPPFSLKPKRLLSLLKSRRRKAADDSSGSSEDNPDSNRLGPFKDIEDSGDLTTPSKLPSVELEPIFRETDASDSHLVDAQEKLQLSVQSLESVLQALTNKPSDKLPELTACVEAAAGTKEPAVLDKLIATILLDGHNRSQNVSKATGEYLKRIAPLSQLALGLTGTIAANAGYAPVQIITNGLSQIITVTQVPGQADSVLQGLESLYDDTDLLLRLKGLPQHVIHSTVKTAAVVLQTKMIDLTRKSILWMKKSFFSKFAECLIQPDELKDGLEDLKQAKQALLNSLDFDRYISKKWDDIFKARGVVLRSVCSDEAHETQLLKHKMLHSSRLPNTGEWAVNHKTFQQWKNGDTRILWCPGKAGAGKTHMVSRMVDELEVSFPDEDVGIAWVYCEHVRITQQSRQYILEVFTRQLLARNTSICDEIKSDLEVPMPLLNDRKRLLNSALSRFTRSFLILDALDEYSQSPAEKHLLASMLRELAEECQSSNVHICITSREDIGVWDLLSRSAIKTTHLPVRASEHDIRALVYEVYDKEATVTQWMNDSWLRQMAAASIIEKSQCIFKLAELQSRSALVSQPHAAAMKSALENLSDSMNTYYKEIIRRIESRANGKIVLKLLTWLTFARSTPHETVLRVALALEPWKTPGGNIHDYNVDINLYLCSSEGLVVQTKEKPSLQLAHQSIREFLQKYWTRGEGYSLILGTCLAFMAVSPKTYFEDPWSIRSSLNFPVQEFMKWVDWYWGEYVLDSPYTAKQLELLESASQVSNDFRLEPPRTCTLLYDCVVLGWNSACRLLLPIDKDPNAWGNTMSISDSDHTAIHAATLVNCDALKLLLADARVDPNKGSLEGYILWTPLMAACANSRENAVEAIKLLTESASVNINGCKTEKWREYGLPWKLNDSELQQMEKSFLPPVMLAYSKRHLLPLLEREDLYLGTKMLGISPLHYFASIGSKYEHLEALLKSPKLEGRLDVNIQTRERLLTEAFPREYATPWSAEKHVKPFESHRSPLLVAAYCGHSKETQLLLADRRTDRNARDQEGMTALMVCLLAYADARFGKLDELEATIRVVLGTVDLAHINAQDRQGRTALANIATTRLVTWTVPGNFSRNPRPWRFPGASQEQKYYGSMFRVVDRSDFVYDLVVLLLGIPGIDINTVDDAGYAPLDHAIWRREITRSTIFARQSLDCSIWYREYLKAALGTYERVVTRLEQAGARSGRPIMITPETLEDDMRFPPLYDCQNPKPQRVLPEDRDRAWPKPWNVLYHGKPILMDGAQLSFDEARSIQLGYEARSWEIYDYL